jgi:hypothetical protein
MTHMACACAGAWSGSGPSTGGAGRTERGGQVHVLTDNAGMELVSDLALAHYLLSCGAPWPGDVIQGRDTGT